MDKVEARDRERILLEILYGALNESDDISVLASKITPEILPELYRLAKKHDLAHVLADFVLENKIEIGSQSEEKLTQARLLSVYRCAQMKYTTEQVCSAFDASGIAHVLLKGAVIRPFYPKEEMRTSCDVDILVHEEDVNSAVSALEKLGYRVGERAYHDVSLYSPTNIHLELHFNILENMDSLDAVLKDAWKYTECIEGYRYRFKKEFFVFHMYSHMAYHFLSGGCGIRALVDIWVMEHRMDAPFSLAKELLTRAGLYKFAEEMSRIANECFSQNSRAEFSDLVLKYIFSGGVYGTKSNGIAVYRSNKKSSFGYFFRRLFMPYKAMVIIYPILKRAPILLPLFWIIRIVKAIFNGKTRRFANEISSSGSVTDEKISEITAIRSRLDI